MIKQYITDVTKQRILLFYMPNCFAHNFRFLTLFFTFIHYIGLISYRRTTLL